MRLMGAALLTLAGTMTGLAARQSLAARVRRRAELGLLLERMAFELERFKTPLPVLLAMLADELDGEAGALCARAAKGLTGPERHGMAAAWDAAVRELPERERAILVPLGSVLGRYGADEQLRALARARAAMERAEAEACAALGQKGRMYVGVPAAAAAALAVLLL